MTSFYLSFASSKYTLVIIRKFAFYLMNSCWNIFLGNSFDEYHHFLWSRIVLERNLNFIFFPHKEHFFPRSFELHHKQKRYLIVKNVIRKLSKSHEQISKALWAQSSESWFWLAFLGQVLHVYKRKVFATLKCGFTGSSTSWGPPCN